MAYDPRPVEPVLYTRWLDAGVFQPRPQCDPYVIVIPPPNVTAELHVGHALNNVVQDVLIRFERMRGRAAEWLPGTDHAGIATQNVVEKQLAAEGKTRFDLGREAFVARVWEFVRRTGDTILEQLKIIGCSCDWSRTRFTLDPAYSNAVREVFVRLWDEGLIYRGHRVIHWCPHCLTSLSDEEAVHHDTNGNLYYIKYPLADGSGSITVATTRPETMLCDTIVEPRLSDQWFVKMNPLAEPVLAEYRRGAFQIVPERWHATFEHWMENIRDWNISRQLWWGHRIPVFTCKKCEHQWAAREDPKKCPRCGGGTIEQDPDVLDTWFSSWLWPFAPFGWPEDTPDLQRFYPGHTLVTAPEILFFWVARMLMAGYHFMDRRLPFKTVYLTGTVRDMKHRKMSKSLGNGIDPRDVVRLYGADALRWTLIGGGSLGADVQVDPDDLETTFAPGRNFANKLWNIGQFVLGQLPNHVAGIKAVDRRLLTLADRWILSRAQAMIRDATTSLEQFRLDEAAKRCYEFAWNELADWYVEAVKPRMTGKDAAKPQAVLAYCLDAALRLLHPVVPFITEQLWQMLPGRKTDELLAVASWPAIRSELEDPVADREFARVKTAIEQIRSIRAEYRVAPKIKLQATIVARGNDRAATFDGERDTIVRLGQLESLALDGGGASKGVGAHAVFGDGSEVIVALADTIDVQQECRRLTDELQRLDAQLQGLAARLTNENFVARAPQDVVAREREKEKAWRDQRDVLAGKLKSLGCS